MRIVYLKPRSSFRGNMRSDTLWGLICWGIRMVHSESVLENFIQSYNDESGLKVSSAFPFYKNCDDQIIRYFPKPLFEPIHLNDFFRKNSITSKTSKLESISKLKKFKNLSLVTEKEFIEFMRGNTGEEDCFKNIEATKIDDYGKFHTSEDVLHNSINRITNSTVKGEDSLYSTVEIFAHKNSGLFFLIDGDQEQLDLAESALRFFNHYGLGGDSSIGKNSFEIAIEDFSMPDVGEANAFVTLSLYSPSDEELSSFSENKNSFWYELENRKGKFGGQFVKAGKFWKKTVMMFKEGSIFPKLKKERYGENIVVKDISEENPFKVYQFGYAFNVPIKLS